MAARLAHMGGPLAPPVFDDDAKTSTAAYTNRLAWGMLLAITPMLLALSFLAPMVRTTVWLIVAELDALSTTLLLATRLGYVKQGAAIFLVGVWAVYSWAAWLSGGVYSPVMGAQFVVVAYAQSAYGWRCALATGAVSFATVSVLIWASLAGLVPASIVPLTPVIYGAVVLACLLSLLCLHGLMGAIASGEKARVAGELRQRTIAEQRMVRLIGDAPFGAFLCEADDGGRLVVTHANREASVALGIEASQLVGVDVGEAFASATCEDLIERFRRVAQEGEVFEAREIRLHSGEARRTLDVHACQTEPGIAAIFFSDVTLQRVAEAKIRRMAYHDELTALPNRKLLLDRLNVAIEAAKRRETGVALLFIDLDNFKSLNDRRGHAFGDQVLMEVAKLLVRNVRASDTVARIGGDEFTVLMPDVPSGEYAERVADKIVEAFRDAIDIGGYPIGVTASVGVTFSADLDIRPEALLELADHAMYEMKRGGRDGYRVA